MRVEQKEFDIHHLRFVIRPAMQKDAKDLSELRLQIDGETENLDREEGEAFIDESGFKQIIKNDTESIHNLFLVVEVNLYFIYKIFIFNSCQFSENYI